jgi:hypothetical protein
MNTRILSIDPGSKFSAWMVYEGRPVEWGKVANEALLASLRSQSPSVYRDPGAHMVVESMVSYGQTVGDEVFATCVWIGRFLEAWESRFGPGRASLLKRPEIKMHLCHAGRATDKDIREALIQRWGGEDVAIGGKRCAACKGKGYSGKPRVPCGSCTDGLVTPRGPLHGIASDCWSALAIATTWTDKHNPALPLSA